MYNGADRDLEIAEIGQMIMNSPDNQDAALARLTELRTELGTSFNNYASRLVAYLQSLPLDERPAHPWVPVFIKELRDSGVGVRSTSHAPEWLPEEADVPT